MKKRDLIFIAIVLIVAIAGFVFSYINKSNEAELLVVITVRGEVYETIPLTEDTDEEIVVEQDDGSYNIVEIHDGHVDITGASCPDQICVHTQQADENGEMIVCLPNQVIVEVISND